MHPIERAVLTMGHGAVAWIVWALLWSAEPAASSRPLVIDADKGTLDGVASGVVWGAPFSVDSSGRETVVTFYKLVEPPRGSSLQVVGSKPATILLKDLTGRSADGAADRSLGSTGVLGIATQPFQTTSTLSADARIELSDFIQPDSKAILPCLTDLAKDPIAPMVLDPQDFYASVMDLFAVAVDPDKPVRSGPKLVFIPEPASWAIWGGLAVGGLALHRRSRRPHTPS